MKIAKDILIYKTPEPDLLKDYRSVSLLAAFSNMVEKFMFCKLLSFFNSNIILFKDQYGCCSKHSPVHPIIHYLTTVLILPTK